MVFDSEQKPIDVELPTTLTDLDNDGKLDFIFRQFGEIYQQIDSLDSDIGTYHPFFVYSVDNNCKLNQALTKTVDL